PAAPPWASPPPTCASIRSTEASRSCKKKRQVSADLPLFYEYQGLFEPVVDGDAGGSRGGDKGGAKAEADVEVLGTAHVLFITQVASPEGYREAGILHGEARLGVDDGAGVHGVIAVRLGIGRLYRRRLLGGRRGGREHLLVNERVVRMERQFTQLGGHHLGGGEAERPLRQGGDDLAASVHLAIHRRGRDASCPRPRCGGTSHRGGRRIHPLQFLEAATFVLPIGETDGGGQGHAFPGQGGNFQLGAVDDGVTGVVHEGGGLGAKAGVEHRID